MAVSEREICGRANFMLEKHGEDAEIAAAQKAGLLLEKGDLEGKRVWMRIIEAISVLRDTGHGSLRH